MLAERPVSALWLLAVILVYQQVENYLLAPRVTAHTMEVHAAVAFGAVLAGAAILGPIGAILALPVTTTLTALTSSLVQRHEVVDDRLTDPAPQNRSRWRRGPESEPTGDSADGLPPSAPDRHSTTETP